MKIEQLYTGCLAEAAYYIESDGEAAIIDPLRETKPYIKMAENNGAKIKFIFETHFHADFVSGHIDLARKTGATIVYGPGAETGYEKYEAKDGEEFKLGKITIKVLHTPGHTLESSSFLLIDEKGKEYAVFTGDTLFIGDVGRPDLVQGAGHSQEEMAGNLYDSLRNKLMTLPDNVIVYPGHGAGSACGKNMSDETFSTMGNQKLANYALQDMTKEEFIEQVTEGIAPPPQYFAKNAKMNKSGYESIDTVLERGMKALNVEETDKFIAEGAIILDTRPPQTFNKGYIPGSINIGLDGSFASWVGALITDLEQTMVIVADEGREEEAVTRLSRVGYDHAIGYLKDGINAWTAAGKSLDSIESISPAELQNRMNTNDLNLLDVRKPKEFEAEHVEGAKDFPLDFVSDGMKELDKSKHYYLYCRSGYRSMVASSILKSQGFENITDVAGGFNAISESSIPKTEYVCPSTLNA